MRMSEKDEAKPGKLALLYARVPEERVVVLRFVIEGCDNLATVSACRGRDMVALFHHPGRRDELVDILETVCGGAAASDF